MAISPVRSAWRSHNVYEIVPNLSEGQRDDVIDACVDAVQERGATVLHRTSDRVHHRSVLTIVGSRKQILEAAVALAGVASRTIDLRIHRGVHPRIGALDVLPFVPLQGASMTDAIALAREAGARIWQEHAIPSFLYGEAAVTPLRRQLAAVRQGQFEGLDARFERPEWRPDFGDPKAHTTAGAIAIGARAILIAFNVELATGEVSVARRIAALIRERDGGMRTLRALGLRLSEQSVQVSLNITNYEATPLYRIVEVIRELAADFGVKVLRGELIGALPRRAVRESASYYLGLLEPQNVE